MAIVGEVEKKEKKKEAQQAILGLDSYVNTPTHESLFEPKEAINLDSLFNHDQLKIASKKRVLIQGSAGIGKTTLCHHISYRWAKGDLFQEFKYLFWLPLRKLNKEHYTSERSLEKFLSQECGVDLINLRSFLEVQELREETLILLDGYDELSPAALNPDGIFYSVLQDLKAFPHVVITTRPQSLDFNPICQLEILGFDARGIEEYIGKFFSEKEVKHAKELRRYLHQPFVRSLARIPVNLEIFCSLVVTGKPLFASSTPTMTALYIQLTDWLFKRFRINRSLSLNNPDEVKEEPDAHHAHDVEPLAKALETIAWKAMEKNITYLKVETIMPIFRSIDKKLQLGDIRRFGPLRIENDEAVFIHLTFQEYFAAVHLADLYESNPEEAKKQLEEIKFKPRYKQVLYMTAGYLSYQSKRIGSPKILRDFFDDLFSEPRDLAISYALKLHARCFEECEDPTTVPQYTDFINMVIGYLKKHPNELLKMGLLTDNSTLISHEEVAQVFIEYLKDSAKLKSSIEILSYLAKRGQIFPPSIHVNFATILNRPNSHDSKIKEDVTKILWIMTESGHPLPEETLSALITVLKDPDSSSDAKSSVVSALGAVAKSGYNLSRDALTALVDVLKDPASSSDAKSSVVSALGMVAMSEHGLSKDALTTLVDVLKDPASSSGGKSSVIFALRAVAKSGHSLSRDALTALVDVLKDPASSSNAKSSVIAALKEVVKNGHGLSKDALTMLRPFLKDSAIPAVTGMTWEPHRMTWKPQDEYGMTRQDEYGFRYPAGLEKNREIDYTNWEKSLFNALTNPEAGGDTQSSAASILAEEVIRQTFLSEKVLAGLVDVLKDPVVGSETKCAVAIALEQVAKKGPFLSKKALSALSTVLANPVSYSRARFAAVSALYEVAKRDSSYFPEEALYALTTTLQDSGASYTVQSFAASVLEELVKHYHPLPVGVLSYVVYPSTSPFFSDFFLAYAFRELAKTGYPIPIAVLVMILTNPKASSHAKSSAAYAFGEQAKKGYELSEEAITALVDLLADSSVGSDAKASAASSLGEVVKGAIFCLKRLLLR